MIKPMLAKKFDPGKVTYPCYVQPKLNGVRGIYIPNPSPYFQSRYGEIWSPETVAHSLSALTGLQLHLDGEFYCHGMSLQQINSRIGVVRKSAHGEREKVKFHVFDFMVDAPFEKRLKVLEKLAERFYDNPYIAVVETKRIWSPVEGDFYYNQWKNLEGYEGMMYRQEQAPYGFASRCGNKDNRWNYLLKRKEMEDGYATIVGFNQLVDQHGKPQPKLGSFQLRAENGATFRAGSGLTDEQRVNYWRASDAMLGARVRYRFEMLSDTLVPLKPIIECVEWV